MSKRARGNEVSQFNWEIGKTYGKIKNLENSVDTLQEMFDNLLGKYGEHLDLTKSQLVRIEGLVNDHVISTKTRLELVTDLVKLIKENLNSESLLNATSQHQAEDGTDPRTVQDKPKSRKSEHPTLG